MSPRSLVLAGIGAATVITALLTLAQPGSAQSLGNGPAATGGPAATPDFTGVWERARNQVLRWEQGLSAVQIPDPPLKPEHMARWRKLQQELAEREKRGQPAGSNYVNCLPDGMPAMMQAMFPMEIIQLPHQINITQEAFNQTRRVYMNEKLPPPEELDPSFFGRSVGRWEGDTLVIETTGIKERVQFRNVPHSERMKIVERMRLVAPDVLQDEVTIHDPEYLEKPWTFTFTYQRMQGYKMLEYFCEDNREYIDESGATRLRIDHD